MHQYVSPEFNIFFHSRRRLEDVLIPADFSSAYNFIDLNALELPAELLIRGMDPLVNKALFSEYLGILTLQPRRAMIGCFTYSIQTKFSARWAVESNTQKFLPSIKLANLDKLVYEVDGLYAVEMTSPKHLIPKEMQEVISRYRVGDIPIAGPFKGSFVVSKELFLELQTWLLHVTKFILTKYKLNEITKVSSPFDQSRLSKRTPEERQIDVLRHTYGTILERAVAYFLGSRFPPSRVYLIGDLDLQRRKQMELERRCIESAEAKDIVISFGNSAYKEIALAWLQKLRDVGVSNYVYVAMDEQLYTLLSELGYNVVRCFFCGSLRDLWVFRLKTINRLLSIGLNVIHSDSDAFWLKNPIAELRSLDGEIISSQGTIYPRTCLLQWGFVLCCGFQYFRSNTKALAFFEELLPFAERIRDDQVAINELLLQHGTVWTKPSTSYKISFNDLQFECYPNPISGVTKSGIRIRLLPHASYQRILENDVKNIFVLHLLSDKTREAKIGSLKEVETNVLKDRDRAAVIWLASFPRSGNTLMRTIFKYNFGLDTYSLYNDRNDIGKFKELRHFVGHKDGAWGVLTEGVTQTPMYKDKVNEVRTEKPTIIKTHSQFHKYYDNFKIIYVVREPRAAIQSYVSYKMTFTGIKNNDEQVLNDLVFDGDQMSGFWGNHVDGWLRNKKDNILLVKYEDILSDFKTTLADISRFIGVEPLQKNLIEFDKYKKANSQFFREGNKNSWENSMAPIYQSGIVTSAVKQLSRFSYNTALKDNDNVRNIVNCGPKTAGKWVYVCTPVLNADATIDRTIQSVVSQEGNFFLHYHIQDGGSKDSTIAKLKRWERLLTDNSFLINCDGLYFTFSSASDRGLYDAISSSFRSMHVPDKNAIMGWINADDILFPGAIETASKIFRRFEDEKWLVGSPYTVGTEGEHRGQARSILTHSRAIAEGRCDGRDFPFLQQEGIFWKSELWNEVGGLNLDLSLAGDWDLWRRFALVCEPLYAHFHFGAFRKRPGQLSGNTSEYFRELNCFRRNRRQYACPTISTEPKVVRLGKDGKYMIVRLGGNNAQSKSAVESTRFAKVTESYKKYLDTRLPSYLLQSAREYIKLDVSPEAKKKIRAACVGKDFDVLQSLLKDFSI